MRQVRVLLAGESPEFARAASDHLSQDPDLQVVGCAETGQEAIRDVERLAPDLVIVDTIMTGLNGLEVTRQIKAQPAPPRVIMLSLCDNQEYRAEAHHAGADSFLSKADVGTVLLPIIRCLCTTQQAEL